MPAKRDAPLSLRPFYPPHPSTSQHTVQCISQMCKQSWQTGSVNGPSADTSTRGASLVNQPLAPTDATDAHPFLWLAVRPYLVSARSMRVSRKSTTGRHGTASERGA
jgi:hypothetical protein